MQFYQTMLGRTFYEAHVPQLIKAVRQLTDELKRYNDAQEGKNDGDKTADENTKEDNG